MKWLPTALSLLLLLVAVPAMAQAPSASQLRFRGNISPGEVAATPEMWFYEQYLNQYQNPQAAVRQKAEFRSAQRQKRIAARKWFGFSNSRPTVGTDCIHGDYSPGWSSNNVYYPFRWSGYGAGIVMLRPAITTTIY